MTVYKTLIFLPDEASVAPFHEAIDPYSLGTAAFEWAGGPGWSLEFYSEGMPPVVQLKEVLGSAAQKAGIVAPEPVTEPLPDIDWVAENQKSFKPIRAGRFYVHQEFHQQAAPPGSVPLIVNAGTAFGTGTHATTWGCLMEIDRLARSGIRTGRALDLGCGTGILAMALYKAHIARRIVASDIDPEAIRVARSNAVLNGTGKPGLHLGTAAGLQHPLIRSMAPYDIIVANILARPLMHLSRDIIHALHSDGIVILSGLLVTQEAMVLGIYRMQGLFLRSRHRRDGWSSLVLSR